MTTNDKTRTGGRRARLGTVGHDFSHDNNPAHGAFRSRRLSREPSSPGFPLRFERHGRFFAAARRSSVFAFLSQNTPKSAENYSTHSAERNASQVIENNQKGYALLDTLRGSRGARNCERKNQRRTRRDDGGRRRTWRDSNTKAQTPRRKYQRANYKRTGRSAGATRYGSA